VEDVVAVTKDEAAPPHKQPGVVVESTDPPEADGKHSTKEERPMRRLALAAAATALLAGFPLTGRYAPALVGRLVAPPPDPAQVQALRRIAESTVRRAEARYGRLPPEKWPEQLRASCEVARGYLEECAAAGCSGGKAGRWLGMN
jgi:hypothetical protein